MISHMELSKEMLHKRIRNGEISFGGNNKLKIFGKLECSSGKRMKKENRVFFNSTLEAIQLGFRPCGHCMRNEYRIWKLKN